MLATNKTSERIPDSFAVIDVGSNSVRALGGRHVGEGIFQIEVDRSIQPRLGAQIDETGQIDPEAIDDVAGFVDSFLANNGPFEKVYCLGTAAAREANNTANLEQKLAAAGVQLQVISGEREAELTHGGALSVTGLKSAPSPASVVDVGGNSTEISTSSDGGVQVSSIPLGAVRLTQRCLKSDPVNPEDLAEAQRVAKEALQPHRSLLESSDTLVAAGGTAVSAGLLCDRWKVSPEDLQQLTAGLAAIPMSARRQLLSFDPGRAEIIVGGLTIFLQVVDVSPAKYMHISIGGLREGVLVEAGAREIDRSRVRVGSEQ